MVSSLDSVHLKLVSGPYWRRVGLWPMALIVGVAWFFVISWLFVAFYVFQYNIFWSLTLTGSTLAFAAFLGFLTSKMVSDSFRDFVLEITDTEAVLSVVDRLRKKRSVQMVLLNDVKYAEYYPYQDSASIILHADYTQMEVPLWPMGTTGRDVVDFLSGLGVRIVNVQSDDKYPD